MSISLRYKDVAVGADTDATVTTSAATSFSDITEVPFGTETGAIATCELNGWGLLDNYKVLDNQSVAFWSANQSNATGTFTTNPTVTLTFDEQYSSTGLTFIFNPESNDYATEMIISWYQGTTLKSSDTFYPNAANYSVEHLVQAFDKIVVEFVKTSLPNKRLKLEKIIIGIIRNFTNKELYNVDFINEVNLISDTLPINVCDATFHGSESVSYIFQHKQPLEAYNNTDLIGVYYINTGKRTGINNYKITAQDMVGLFENEWQDGGLWFTDTPLTTILSTIFGTTSIFNIDSAYTNTTLRGFIEPGNKRSALQQIVFALGAVADTSCSNKIKIFPVPIANDTEIDATKTYNNGDITTTDAVTEVTVTAYIITDERPSNNDEYIEYNGVQYKYYTDTKHAYNPNTISTDPQKKIKFDKSYLCNLSNAQTIANNIISYYMRTEHYNFNHILEEQKTADYITALTPWDSASGNIIKMSISCSGIIVSNTDLLLD